MCCQACCSRKGTKRRKKGRKQCRRAGRSFQPVRIYVDRSVRPPIRSKVSQCASCLAGRWPEHVQYILYRYILSVRHRAIHPPARPAGRREGGIDRRIIREARRRRLYLRWTQKLEVRFEVFKRKCPNVSSLLAWCQT